MRLYDPLKLVEYLGFDQMTDITLACEEAVEGATALLSARLGSDFDRVTHTDLFYVDPGHTGPYHSTSFRLSHGFVQSVTAAHAAASKPALDTDNLSLDDALLRGDVGELRDTTNNLGGRFVRVTYVAGFDPDPIDPSRYAESQVPDWLAQAARLQALVLLVKHPTLEQGNTELDARSLNMQLEAITARRIRYLPAALLPL